ncbi:ABC transporter ATP-binding protein [Methanoculleus sp. MH98A]|uniref:ABC transporter ATP-binding protein n=1 Tax=Methanoculleus sp. MH98A TaxID=1495314 RepID=UPI0004A09AA7|nr:ABC transporter ATP-binding protein [Methanoculleus sp. MH98A]KDE55887.1 iron ABC transporter ATP-binding protein [Methanoculleus sp. MH98A]
MILSVDGLAFDYRSTPALSDVRFALGRNEVLSILGPNGVGKTTLLKCINTILTPKNGAILIDGREVLALNRVEIAREIGYVPQRCETGRLTVFDAILLGRRPHIRWNISENDLKVVDAAIRRLNLEALSLRYIDEISGGELQKVSVARAFVQEPRLLLLDEPTSSLDLKNQLDILRIVREAVREQPVSAVMTMHDLNLALRYSDGFIFLKEGTIFAAGGSEVVTPAMLREVYGVHVIVERHKGIPVVIPLEEGSG